MKINLKQDIIQLLELMGNKNSFLVINDILESYLSKNIDRIKELVKLNDEEDTYLEILQSEKDEKH